MISLLLAFSLLPFNPDYSVKGCSDNEIILLDEFQTILEYPSQTPAVFENGSVRVLGILSPYCNRINAQVTVSFDIDENGNLINYKTLKAEPNRVADREVKKAIYKGKVIESMYGAKSIQVTVHYLQYKSV